MSAAKYPDLSHDTQLASLSVPCSFKHNHKTWSLSYATPVPCLPTNLLALFALRPSCDFLRRGAPRACDAGGRHYGTVVRAQGRCHQGPYVVRHALDGNAY